MEKLDKIIAGLNCCTGDQSSSCEVECPYFEGYYLDHCTDRLKADTLDLIRDLVQRLKMANRKADGDLISRGELEKALSMLGRMYVDGIADDKAHLSEQRVYEALRNARTVAAEPIIHAHWIPHEDYLGLSVECSACHIETCGESPRCPVCGAYMDEEVADG